MSADEKQKLKALFVATAMYFGQDIPDQALRLYVEDLEDLPFDRVASALCDVRRDPRTTRCPLPAVIRAKVNPESDPEAEAVEAVSRITHAIARIGPYRVEEAREYIGPLGWIVVQREGGWEAVCGILTDDNIGILKAQWRQMAVAQFKRAKAGLIDAPALPSPTGGIVNPSALLPSFPGDPA